MSLKDHNLIVDMMPAGGWRYEQEFKGSIQRIPPSGCAGGGRELVDLVTLFRAHNGIEVGDVELDVANFIKKASPQNDRFRTGPVESTSFKTKSVPLIRRITTWMSSLSGKRIQLIHEYDARERAEVCSRCRMNVRWKVECEPCNDDVVSRGRAVRRRIEFSHDDSLRACRIHDLYLPAAVFLDKSLLPRKVDVAPGECWL